MPTANSPASNKVVTAALLVIGGKILSGRTKDQNIGYIAEYLTALGVDLKEVRVVGGDERAIVDALNALRQRYTYVFTTGGIGPTHSDITADCVAKAFGVPIDPDPRASDSSLDLFRRGTMIEHQNFSVREFPFEHRIASLVSRLIFEVRGYGVGMGRGLGQ